MLPRFSYAGPRNLDETLALLAEHGPRAKLLAGGTDLMPKMAKGALKPQVVISLKRVPELRPIVYDADKGLSIGASARLAEVLEHPDIRRHYPAVADAAAQTANGQIRNMGTLAGNLCNGSPCADSAPTLLAMGARMVLAKRGATRTVPLDEFFVGPAVTVIAPDELLVRIEVPPPRPNQGFAYQNVQARAQVDVSAASVGVGVTAVDGRIGEVRIFLGAVGPTPLRAVKAEEAVRGRDPAAAVFAAAGTLASSESRPITDVRATASYRRRVIGVLARRALALAATRAGLSVKEA